MTFTSSAFFAEVGPYYGTLDQVYRLMRKTWRKTNQMWDGIKNQLRKVVYKRKCTTIGDTLIKDIHDEDYFQLITNSVLIYTLFKLSYWKIASKEDYEALWSFLEGLQHPEMVEFDRIGLQIYKDRSVQYTPVNYSLGLTQTNEPMINEYNRLVSLMKKIGLNLDQINSYCYVEDIPNLTNLQYIRTIIFSWTPESNNRTLIETWENAKKKSNIEFDRILIIWTKDETDSLVNLLSSIKEAKIVVKLSNKHRIKFYTTMKSMDIREDQNISIYLWNKSHNIFYEMEHKKQRKRSDQVVEISFENCKLTSLIKDTNNYLVALNMTIFTRPSEIIFKDSESLTLQPNFNLIWFDLKKYSFDQIANDQQLNQNIVPVNFNNFKWKNIKSVIYNTDVTKDWTPSLSMIPSRTWNRSRDLADDSIWVVLKSTKVNNLFDVSIKFNGKADITQTRIFIDKIGLLYNWRNVAINGVYSSQLSSILESQNASITLRVFRIEMEEPLSFLDRFKCMKVIHKYQNKNIKFYISEKSNQKTKIVFESQ